jgi:hypothetical protein
VHVSQYSFSIFSFVFLQGIHRFMMTFTNPQGGTNGEELSITSAGIIGLVSSAVDRDKFSLEDGVQYSGAWWGLTDDGNVCEGKRGFVRELPSSLRNSSNYAFGSGDEILLTVNMDLGLLSFSRNGTPLEPPPTPPQPPTTDTRPAIYGDRRGMPPSASSSSLQACLGPTIRLPQAFVGSGGNRAAGSGAADAGKELEPGRLEGELDGSVLPMDKQLFVVVEVPEGVNVRLDLVESDAERQ